MKNNTTTNSGNRLIETDGFPFAFLSELALRESWRKEVYRPIYHVHKWWAKRLGSVFRGILLGSLLPEKDDLKKAFYQGADYTGVTVFDPFMGSGTTIGEAHKLGCTALGRDINAVACESVRVALGPLNRDRLQNAFAELSDGVGERIRSLYKSSDGKGQSCDVLYFFWIKQAPCPSCATVVDLFPSYVIARNAYPDRKPVVQIYCPICKTIFPELNHKDHVQCPSCCHGFNPHQGPAAGMNATCTHCSHAFSVAEAVRATKKSPAHRLYGKLLLDSEGNKRYLSATSSDVAAYEECSRMLKRAAQRGTIRLPDTVLVDGHNTRQAINYNYREWKAFFNDRQLLALGWLHEAVVRIDNAPTRDALLSLFSGVLEFNNVFASYKGEGTGAVRHMFSHHILKPERAPIEANIWGTPKSSGSFSNLFKSRLMRALDYRDAPFEVGKGDGVRTVHCGKPFVGKVKIGWPEDKKDEPRGIFLTCGDSAKTDLPDKCIDLVVTDPPFFDNVHYSELADFFYAWQRLHPRGFINTKTSTRNVQEVQDTEADAFANKLQGVFKECRRVLKDAGLLVFSYHHSRKEGWAAVAQALCGAGFSIVKSHPVKSEMSVAAPKSQAKEPIQLDVIFVCRKQEDDRRDVRSPDEALKEAMKTARPKAEALASAGLKLSRNDIRVVVYSEFLSLLGTVRSADCIELTLSNHMPAIESFVEETVKTIQKMGVADEKSVSHQMELSLT